jgi:hypothetical protein
MVQLMNEVTILFRTVNKASKEIGRIQKTVEQVGKVTTITTRKLDQFGQEISKNQQVIEEHRQRFQFWALSIMFGAMQVSRFLGRVLGDIAKSYFTITEKTTGLGQATLRLQAAFTFLQVSLMEAFAPILIPIIEAIVKMVEWFGDLDPRIQMLIMGFLVLGFVFSKLVMWFAQLTLIGMGFKLMMAQSAINGGLLAGMAGKASTAIGEYGLAGALGLAFGALIRIILPLLALYLIIAYGRKAIAGWGLMFNEVFTTMADVAYSVIGVIQNVIIGFINTLIDAYNVIADILGMAQKARMGPLIDIAKKKEELYAKWGEQRKAIYDWGQGPELMDYLMGTADEKKKAQATVAGTEGNTQVNNVTVNVEGNGKDDTELAKKISDQIMNDIREITTFSKTGELPP